LEALLDDASAEEKDVLNQLYGSFQDQHGTLLTMAESLHGQHLIIQPSAIPAKYVDLQSLDDTGDIYLATGDEQVPVLILQHFQVETPGEVPAICTVVARLMMQDVLVLPWSLYADNLGYYVTEDNIFEPIEVVSPEQLVLPVVTSSFVMNGTGKQLRVVVAYDQTGCKIFEDGEGAIEEDVI
ncbi:hypothetical protein FRC11_002104, partial [Ceratobasidium sp. 423]